MQDFNRYRLIHNEIMKRLEVGEITTEQAKSVIDLAFDKYTNDSQDVIIEKASREYYKMSKFKKKYNYDPKEKTITVDGIQYKVNLDTKSPTMKVTDFVTGRQVATLRQTSVDTFGDDNTINIDENFFKLKNAKRQDAILQHEIGHIKYQNLTPKSKHFNPDNALDKVFDTTMNQILANFSNYSDDVVEYVKSVLKQKRKDYLDASSKDEMKNKIRSDAYEIAKKYKNNCDEVEADRHSANKTSEKDLKRGYREINKLNASDKSIKTSMKVHNDIAKKHQNYDDIVPINKENIEKWKKDQKDSSHKDYVERSKALKDKELSKQEIYKK